MEWTVSSHYYHYFASAIAQETAVGFEHNAKWQSLELFLFIRLTTLWRDEFWQGFVLNSTSLTSISATDQQSCYCHVWRGKRRGNVEILHLLLWMPVDHCRLPSLIRVTGLSAGPMVLGSVQHLAPLPRPLRTVTGQHLFIDTGPIPQTAARNRFSHLHGVNTSAWSKCVCSQFASILAPFFTHVH